MGLAHPVTVDGNDTDWFVRPGPGPDLGILARNFPGEGEFMWQDAPGDERTDFGGPDPDVDLREFRVTASSAGLCFLARLEDVTAVSGNGAVQIQVAIDIDRIPASGQTWLGSFVDTQTAPEAAWEYLVVTRFGSGNPTPLVYDVTWNNVAAPESAAAAISQTAECVEIRVPWGLIGGDPTGPLGFTVAVLRSDDTDTAWDLTGASDVLDAVTNYGDPGLAANTFLEVADGVIDYHFDIWFHLDPDLDPASPVLITEVLYDAVGAEPAEEWVEIYNAAGTALSLEGYRLGDEEVPDGSEGMRVFPAGAILESGEVNVVAVNATYFNTRWSQMPDYEVLSAEAGVPDLVADTAWAAGLISLGNSGDQVILTDASWTLLDVVTYESGVFPGITAALGVIADQSIRRDVLQDTDDCSDDFSVATPPSPGELEPMSDVPVEMSDRSQVLRQNHPNPFNPRTVIAFDLQQAAVVTLEILDVSGRRIRTLVSGLQADQGYSEVIWDGRDGSGRAVAAGSYLYRLSAGEIRETRHMTLVK